jgi:hypothetical protein
VLAQKTDEPTNEKTKQTNQSNRGSSECLTFRCLNSLSYHFFSLPDQKKQNNFISKINQGTMSARGVRTIIRPVNKGTYMGRLNQFWKEVTLEEPAISISFFLGGLGNLPPPLN